MTVAGPVADAATPRLDVARHFRTSVAFFLAKGAVVVAPLVLARMLSKSDYGLLEVALAWASPLSVVVAFGSGAAVPYFLLQRRQAGYTPVFYFHVLIINAIVLGILVLGALRVVSVTMALASAFAGVMASQVVQSTFRRVHDRPVPAVFLESGLYLVLLGFAVATSLVRVRPTLLQITVVVSLYLCVLVLVAVHKFRGAPARRLLARYRVVLKFGGPLIFSALLIGVLTAAGRLVAGVALPPEDIAYYAFYFRLAATVVVVHQLLNLMFYRRLYLAAPAALDRYFAAILLVMALCAISAFLLYPPVVRAAFPTFMPPGTGLNLIFLTLAIHTVFWTATAQAEMVIYREKLSGQLAGVICAVLAAAGLLAAILHRQGLLDLLAICQIHIAAVFSVFAMALVLLSRRGIPLRRTGGFATIVFVLLAVVTMSLAHG